MRNRWAIVALALSAIVVGGLVLQPSLSALDPVGPQAADNEKPDAEDSATKIKSLERKLALAAMKLEQAQLEAEAGLIAAQASVRQSGEELAIAQGKMHQYREFDSKRGIEESRLALLGSKDRAEEAAEELAQIDLMYKDQDLDDRTAEFVIKRGRRNAERAAAHIQLEEMALAALTEHEVPREIRQHELTVSQKQIAVETAKRSLQSQLLKNQISIASAESEIAGLREELEQLRKQR